MNPDPAQQVPAYRQRVDRLKSQAASARALYRQEQQRQKDLEARAGQLAEALRILQEIAQALEEYSHQQISRVVTSCLQTVMPDQDYHFEIHFERKRGRTEARLCLYNGGELVEDPLEDESGGVLDVASFALHVAALMLCKPALRPLLVLDEPFKFVSVNYRDNVREMIERLARDCGIQFIIVTHMTELQMGQVLRLE
jgi:DNA repair exonuclease SbcCD ATPase subunit